MTEENRKDRDRLEQIRDRIAACDLTIADALARRMDCVEEIIALILFPVKVVIALMTPLIGLATVIGIGYGIVLWFDNGFGSALAFGFAAILPLVLPIFVYFGYLLAVCTLDLYKAIVSIPRKLDELKK